MNKGQDIRQVNEIPKVNRLNAYDIREALRNNSLYVYAKDQNGVEYRIINVKTHKGVACGRALGTGKWFQISGWELR
jgi:hypothetical protein